MIKVKKSKRVVFLHNKINLHPKKTKNPLDQKEMKLKI